MKKITKTQREILQSAVDVMDKSSIKQPIHCVMKDRSRISEFSKSYASYSNQMYALFDAGVLEKADDTHSYVYVKDYAVARQLLAM